MLVDTILSRTGRYRFDSPIYNEMMTNSNISSAEYPNPQQMLSSLREEMTLIKAEEMFLKKQILSLNDQFQDLMSSVAKLYPDILNEEFAKKPEKGLLQIVEHDMSGRYDDSYQRTEKRSRWNDWKEERTRRRSFTGDKVESREQNSTKPGDVKRPSSLLVGGLNGVDEGERKHSSPKYHQPRSSSEPRSESPRSVDYGTRLSGVDSERRRRIRQRLKESRKKLDVVQLGLF